MSDIRACTLVLSGIFVNFTMGFPQNAASASHAIAQQGCEPIGRVLTKGDAVKQVGSLVCKGDRLSLAPGKKVSVLCFLNGKVLHLNGGIVSEAGQCVPGGQTFRPCSSGDSSYCTKPKGASDNNLPALVSPYSSALVNGRPFLSWYAVPKSSSYTISVRGFGVNWQRTIEDTILPYPSEQPAMQLGNAYKITIIAKQDGSPVSASESVVNLLPQSDTKQIKNAVKRINSLHLPKDEAAFLDLDSIYMSRNLLDETISTLEARVKAGSQNPAVYRLIGDRYLEAGRLEHAKTHYQTAIQLAKRADNLAEEAKATTGLKLAGLHSQLPTRIKGAQ